jgi:predicted secreted hydrolase
MRPALYATLALALLAALAWGLSREEMPVSTSTSISEALATDTTGYARALTPRTLVFPADHGPHPDYKLEWWYLTGNLAGPEGERYGYQFTLFRNAVAPPPARLASTSAAEGNGDGWTTRQLYLAHFAVTDAEGQQFYAYERFSRGAADLAGAQADPFRVWLEDWTLEGEGPGGTIPPMRLRAAAAPGEANKGSGEGTVALDLRLDAAKPLVLQGQEGFSPKGEGEGNASFYYSFTRLLAEGTITFTEPDGDARVVPVEGTSWMDREWSTSLLGETQTGWDWFSLQLGDGRDAMFFRVREADPEATPYTDGVVVDPSGEAVAIDGSDVALEVLDEWTSAQTGATYPTAWRMSVPAHDLDLRLTALYPEQEMATSVAYWEGAVRIQDATTGDLLGYGYVELTGYGDNEALGR